MQLRYVITLVEATIGFEPMNNGFANRRPKATTTTETSSYDTAQTALTNQLTNIIQKWPKSADNLPDDLAVTAAVRAARLPWPEAHRTVALKTQAPKMAVGTSARAPSLIPFGEPRRGFPGPHSQIPRCLGV